MLAGAVDLAEFDVVNHSWGGAPTYTNDTAPVILAYRQAAEDATATGRNGLGTIILKAAGNWADSAQGDFSDTTRHSITVAAYDSDGDASRFRPARMWFRQRSSDRDN